MKYCSSIILLLCLTVYTNAQQINYYPDSIRIELPDQKTIVVIEMREFKSNTQFILNFPAFIREMTGYIQKSLPENEIGPYHIDVTIVPEGEKEILSTGLNNSFKPIGEKTLISIRKIDQAKTQLTIKEKRIIELLPPGWEMTIHSDIYKVKLYSESLQSLLDVGNLDFSDLSSRLINEADFKSLGKKSIRSGVVFRENKIDQLALSRKYPGDNIFLTGYGGVGVFRDRIYPQLSFELGVTFRDHFNRQNVRVSLISDHMFFTERTTEGFQLNTNSFLSLSFEKNFNKKTIGPQWLGLGIGFQPYKNQAGDYFKGNTVKFFATHKIASSAFSIAPEFYLTNDLKDFAFGVALKFHL